MLPAFVFNVLPIETMIQLSVLVKMESMKKIQMNVSAHPTIMKQKTELAKNVIINVKNVQPLLRIVPMNS